jgi:hypothetical protein
MFSTSSRARLTEHDLGRFTGQTLFDRVGRVVCRAGCLPRKELFEAWEVARRVRRAVRGGRVVDLCGGHGMLAQFMLLLDDSSPSAVVVDTQVPPSAARVQAAVVDAWPRLVGRVSFVAGSLETFELHRADVVVSSHACGDLTDLVIERAALARAPVAVLPCCHDMVRTGGNRRALAEAGDPRLLEGWIDRGLAIDILRARWLQEQGYQVRTQAIPTAITPKNRLLIGVPEERGPGSPPRASRSSG